MPQDSAKPTEMYEEERQDDDPLEPRAPGVDSHRLEYTPGSRLCAWLKSTMGIPWYSIGHDDYAERKHGASRGGRPVGQGPSGGQVLVLSAHQSSRSTASLVGERTDWDAAQVADGDVVEAAHLMSGG
ncbi:MAG: hypothetical protein MZV63_46740 [Marinilabiliales bacterium]|nr:hypothetical protein [Marinilabiliales bacterium]